MNSQRKKDSSLLFNLMTLFAFGLGLFLIIFLKHGESKNFEQKKKDSFSQKSRVKNSKQLSSEGGESEKVDDRRKSLNGRQEMILRKVEKVGSMSPGEIYKLVPDVSTRTVRRDMDKLVQVGFVSQEGTTKSTQYIFKG